MKTILLFPGVDAIESDQLRKTAIQWAEVQNRILEAQLILDQLQVPIALEEVMHGKRKETLEWFSAMALAAMAVQVGVFDRYRAQCGRVDILLGMSLGDLARSVCAGVSSFSSTLTGLLQFLELAPSVAGSGSTYQVRLQEANDDITSLLQCERYGVAISVYQSDISFVVSGPVENLKQWAFFVNGLDGAATRELYKIPIPLHHELLKNLALSITPHIERSACLKSGIYSIYSSIFAKHIETSAELRDDMAGNICTPVMFAPAIHRITKEKDMVEFINIGPASTMLAFIKQMKIPKDRYQTRNYFSEESM